MKCDELRKRIDEYAERSSFSGVIRVTLKGERVFEHSAGYAVLETKTPFDGDSMFTFYSLSKPFCAIGLMLLRDRGLVDIDKHPGEYLPEAAYFDSRVTIRQLLHHTSGIPDFEQSKAFEDKRDISYTAEDLRGQLSELARLPQYFDPGTGHRYTNTNFIIPALIIENVTGVDYAEFMRREVFEPLGMKKAVIDRRGMEIPNRVQGYELCDGRLIPVDRSYSWLLGGGDIIGTVDDVYRLNVAIKEKALLSKDSWEQILTPFPVSQTGLGCFLLDWHGKLRIQHNGGHRGFRTLHVQVPEDDLDIILLSNAGFGDARDVIPEYVHESFYGADGVMTPRVEMDKGYI